MSNRLITAYYAHPVSDYDKPIERYDIQLLTRLGFEVMNPNHPDHQEGYKRLGMEYFTTLVSVCDVFAFRAFSDGLIGAGVAAEMRAAEQHCLPIFELPYVSSRIMTVEETRNRLALLRAR